MWKQCSLGNVEGSWDEDVVVRSACPGSYQHKGNAMLPHGALDHHLSNYMAHVSAEFGGLKLGG